MEFAIHQPLKIYSGGLGFLAGSPLQVSGPAAGLAVIVGQLIQEHGYQTLGLIVMLAGGIQLLAGRLGFGQWFRAVSPAVIQGMLAGIGILIFAAQFHVMVDDRPPGTGKSMMTALKVFPYSIALSYFSYASPPSLLTSTV